MLGRRTYLIVSGRSASVKRSQENIQQIGFAATAYWHWRPQHIVVFVPT